MIAVHWNRPGLFAFALFVALSPGAFAACTIATPADWSAGSARWDGECTGNTANGLGVLKEQQGTAVKRLFFGRVQNGELAEGVIEVPEQGFVAGRFEQGRVLASDERQTLIDAFEVAAQAAAAAAERFVQAGNSASANFYRSKEQVLREQLD
ncbi:MAG: hypothetical protein AAAB16_19190 [Pseudomonas sp.]|uniref:hypothetical protein n=1 Tax=Pseudomonas sp. TaxID=306 RepID=UPI0030F1D2E7